MKVNFKNIWGMIKDTFKSFSGNDTATYGAALSYYTVFSLAPVLVIIIAVAGLVFGHDAVSGKIFDQAQGMLGAKPAAQLQEMIKATNQPGKNIIATIISGVLLIVGATTIMNQLQVSLNNIWGVKPKPKLGLIKYVRDRILSFVFIIAVGFLLLVSLALDAALVALTHYMMSMLPDYSVYLFRAMSFVLSLIVIGALFTMMFKYLPDANIKWGDVWVGGVVTALLFTIGKYLIGLYLGQANVASTFGAAGSVIIIFVWVYYSSQILFLGAEFTKVYACTRGRVIEPSKYAVKVKSVDIEQSKEEPPAVFEKRAEKLDNAAANNFEPLDGEA
jgi:membrane protein